MAIIRNALDNRVYQATSSVVFDVVGMLLAWFPTLTLEFGNLETVTGGNGVSWNVSQLIENTIYKLIADDLVRHKVYSVHIHSDGLIKFMYQAEEFDLEIKEAYANTNFELSSWIERYVFNHEPI